MFNYSAHALSTQCIPKQGRPQSGCSGTSAWKWDILKDRPAAANLRTAAGIRRESRKAAEHFISVFEASSDPIVIPSGSCASMVKNHYPELFKDDDRMRAKGRGHCRPHI